MIQEIELTGPKKHFIYNGKYYQFAKPAVLFEDAEGSDTKAIAAAVFFDEENNYITAPLSEVSGIPITREILENASFIDGEKEFQSNIMSIADGKMLLYTFEDKVTLFEFPCQYVHQLQNLYFAMTGEELEIAL